MPATFFDVTVRARALVNARGTPFARHFTNNVFGTTSVPMIKQSGEEKWATFVQQVDAMLTTPTNGGGSCVHAEPQRPPLPWAAPAQRDRFPGFVVRRMTQPQSGTAPEADTGHQVNPLHGSAALLRG